MIAALTSTGLSGCGVTDFDITQPVPEQRVSGSPLPGPLAVLFPLPLSIDISSKIKAMETGPIDSVTLSKLTLKITAGGMTSGDTDDWSFVDSIHVLREEQQERHDVAARRDRKHHESRCRDRR